MGAEDQPALAGAKAPAPVAVPAKVLAIVVPVIIAGSQGTTKLLEAIPEIADARYWVRFLGAFDVIFLALSLWVFEPLLAERS